MIKTTQWMKRGLAVLTIVTVAGLAPTARAQPNMATR